MEDFLKIMREMFDSVWDQTQYDYTKTYPQIDYSEVVTEPGLVLSMREIYERYVLAGQSLDDMSLVIDDDADYVDDTPDFDDALDMLQHSKSVSAMPRMRSASKAEKSEPSEDGNKPQSQENQKEEPKGDDDDTSEK